MQTARPPSACQTAPPSRVLWCLMRQGTRAGWSSMTRSARDGWGQNAFKCTGDMQPTWLSMCRALHAPSLRTLGRSTFQSHTKMTPSRHTSTPNSCPPSQVVLMLPLISLFMMSHHSHLPPTRSSQRPTPSASGKYFTNTSLPKTMRPSPLCFPLASPFSAQWPSTIVTTSLPQDPATLLQPLCRPPCPHRGPCTAPAACVSIWACPRGRTPSAGTLAMKAQRGREHSRAGKGLSLPAATRLFKLLRNGLDGTQIGNFWQQPRA